MREWERSLFECDRKADEPEVADTVEFWRAEYEKAIHLALIQDRRNEELREEIDRLRNTPYFECGHS